LDDGGHRHGIRAGTRHRGHCTAPRRGRLNIQTRRGPDRSQGLCRGCGRVGYSGGVTRPDPCATATRRVVRTKRAQSRVRHFADQGSRISLSSPRVVATAGYPRA
jgi:hypothetical protein